MIARNIAACNTIPEVSAVFDMLRTDDTVARYLYLMLDTRLKTLVKGTDHKPGVLQYLIAAKLRKKK